METYNFILIILLSVGAVYNYVVGLRSDDTNDKIDYLAIAIISLITLVLLK